MSKPTSARIEAVRRFSRFYTKQIGILDDGLPESPFSRTEGRVLCELAHHDTTSAGQLADALGIDAGYLSRILRSLEKRGVLLKTRSTLDGRQMLISLSGDGISAGGFVLDRSNLMPAFGELLSPAQIRALVAHIRTLCACEGPPWSNGAVR